MKLCGRWLRSASVALVAVALGALSASVNARGTIITVSSTTSTEQSGLFGFLLPQFQKASGITVKVVALGTGQALDVVAAATPTWCSYTIKLPKKNSWRTVRAWSASP